jgi:hypothetical protein
MAQPLIRSDCDFEAWPLAEPSLRANPSMLRAAFVILSEAKNPACLSAARSLPLRPNGPRVQNDKNGLVESFLRGMRALVNG